MFTPCFFRCKRNRGRLLPSQDACLSGAKRGAHEKGGGPEPAASCHAYMIRQPRRVRTKFCPVALVQLSWLVETRRQLKLMPVWRISEVPVISTEVAPVSL